LSLSHRFFEKYRFFLVLCLMTGDMGQVFFLPWLLIAIFSYLIGSLPTGYLAGRLCGVDLRTQGSGNIGATNALRVLGKVWGYGVFLVDFLKGLLPVVVAGIWSSQLGIHPASAPGALAGLCVLLGHSFPVWLGFQGGKGIASSAGVIVGLFPFAMVLCIGSWGLFFTITRYVSVASIAASIALPIAVTILLILHRADWLALVVSLLMCLLALWRHRSNIARLRTGTEPRFEKKSL
jgi:glycerol-3-phosphate acyltransferase PlsY